MSERAENLRIVPYDLPDEGLLDPQSAKACCKLFVPPQTLVVIGKGSDPEKELQTEDILVDAIPVMRRASGGCAVLLSQKMLVAAFANYEQPQPKSAEFFQTCNEFIIEALRKLAVDHIEFAGTSDLARQGRKIAGTAIYRNRNVVFYHAIINLAERSEMIARYLQTPPRMPDYRAGRDHEHFVSSLRQEGFSIKAADLAQSIEGKFKTYLGKKEEETWL